VKTRAPILILRISIHDCFPTAPGVCTNTNVSAQTCLHKHVAHGEERWMHPPQKTYLAYGQVSSGRFTTIGVEVLLTTTQ
jgi:methylaspartate ammonia-lyase